MRLHSRTLSKGLAKLCGSLAAVSFLLLAGAPAGAQSAPPRAAGKPASTAGNRDVRVQSPKVVLEVLAANGVTVTDATNRARQRSTAIQQGGSRLSSLAPGADVSFSALTGSAEVVRNPRGTLTTANPGASSLEVVLGFLHANKGLYGLSDAEIEALHFKGESVSKRSGLHMVRLDQVIGGVPVFQSDSRFLLDRAGRLVRSVALLMPQATTFAPPAVARVGAAEALATALHSVGIDADAARMEVAGDLSAGHSGAIDAHDSRVLGEVATHMVYFPLAPSVLVPAWMQVSFTSGPGDWTTVVDAASGQLLWRKNIRSYASTEEARFNVYVQADGSTPADSPAPHSPTMVTPGSGTQFPEIARTTINMLTVQDTSASPDGWISDGGNSTTGNNVDAYLDTDGDNVPDPGTLDNNGRPVGNVDANTNNRDFLGTGYAYTPPPMGGNPDAGTAPTDTQEERGAVTHLFYLANWYHDQLYSYGFDEAAGNFQTNNFGMGGTGGDPVLAESHDGSGTNNANFSTPPDGSSGRMQMFIFTGPTPDRDGSLDAEVVLHEMTHGLSNRLIGDANGLIWDAGGGMGEGWSDFYALSLLNHTNADDPNGEYASGAYATYKLIGLTDNYLYGIRRFPYSTDNSVNPLTWADVDDVTIDTSGGIATSPIDFNSGGALEVHNVGEVWALTLWEVRSRVIADPAGANGDVPTGNATMLQLTTDALKMTPINPSFTDARDALIDADCATNGCANETSIWGGFADRGLGYGAISPLGQVGVLGSGGYDGVGESFSLPFLDVQSVAIDDSLGNNNGAIDPGEPVMITVTLFNPWRNAARGVASVAATLSTSTAGVVVTDPASAYGAIPAQGSAAGDSFLFTVPSGATCGQSLHFTIQTTSSLGTTDADFVLRVGAPAGDGAPITYTRAIPGGLAIPDNDLEGVTDSFNVTDDLEISKLELRIDSLTHTFTGDLAVGFKAPNGYGTDMAYLRGTFTGDSDGDNFTNTLFKDDSTNDLNLSGAADAPFTGDWEPAFNGDIWALFGIPNLFPDPVGQLSRLDGTSTLGTWKVHASDQAFIDTGTLNSWSLIVTPKTFTCTPFIGGGAIVSGTKSVAGAFQEGGAITYTVVLSNSGTADQADNPGDELTDVLPAGITLVSATASSGTAVANTGTNTVTWDGTIPMGGNVTITIQATIDPGTAGATLFNQGTISYDSNNDGTNDASAVTDDPATVAANDPTPVTVARQSVVEVPTLSGAGLALLCLLLAGTALLLLRRRRTT